MTDLEITRLCAEAMGLQDGAIPADGAGPHGTGFLYAGENNWADTGLFDPLHDDAQAMALVKKFNIACNPPVPHMDITWETQMRGGEYVDNTDLNRAICECVAKMQLAKAPA